jgi:crotonobetainyl-CoA:carnitine CoA-transferase CaiB-like acyl-CoA transferase
MIEGEFQVLGDAYMDFAMNGRERMRAANDHPGMEPHGVFRCQGDDAWVAIVIEDEAQWRALCGLIGQADLATECPSVADRKERRAAITAAITAWTSLRTHYEAQEALQGAGIPAGAVLNAVELLGDPHVRAYSGFEYVETPGVGPTPYPRIAARLRGTPVPVSGPAPAFAEANTYVLREVLHRSEDELAALKAAHVIVDEPAGESH